MHKASFEKKIGSVYFRISFFKDHSPDLVVDAISKYRVSVRLTWEEIINCYLDPLAIFAELHSVDAFFVPLLRNEEPFNQRRSLGQNAKSGKKVVVI